MAKKSLMEKIMTEIPGDYILTPNLSEPVGIDEFVIIPDLKKPPCFYLFRELDDRISVSFHFADRIGAELPASNLNYARNGELADLLHCDAVDGEWLDRGDRSPEKREYGDTVTIDEEKVSLLYAPFPKLIESNAIDIDYE